jgi:cell filamentation protein
LPERQRLSEDPYIDGDVMRNKLGIRDPDELRTAEYDLVEFRTVQVEAHPVRGQFDLAHLRDIHREREDYIAAAIASFEGNVAPLQDILNRIRHPHRQG